MGPPPVAVPQTSVFYANDDTVIGQSNEVQKRYNVSLKEISPYVKRQHFLSKIKDSTNIMASI